MNNYNNGAQPAFPKVVPDGDQQINGMSKREYIATMNMNALIRGFVPMESKYSVNDGYMDFDAMAEDSCKAADALLNQLSKPQL